MIKITKNAVLDKIQELANKNTEIEILWLYGSRAREQATETSDYDLAVCFKKYIEDPIDNRLRPELLALTWQKTLGVSLSIVDFNQASLPLAYTVVQDNFLLFSSNEYRRMVEEQKIMSKWETDHFYHRKHYA